MEGANLKSQQVMESLEMALRDVSDAVQPLHSRLGPVLAALFHNAETADLGMWIWK